MYFKIFFLIWIFLFFVKNVSSQFIFKGRVTNIENNSIIEKAVIRINDKQIIVTDINGNFEFSFEKESVSISIECIGFKKKKEIINANIFLNIQLMPIFSVLEDVTVFSGAKNIILKSINAISFNYPQKYFIQKGYLNFESNEVQDNLNAFKKINVKAILQVNNTAYKKNSNKPTIDLIANKIIQYNSKSKLTDSINWVMFYYSPVNYDIVHNRDYFLDISSLNKYSFILKGKKYFDGNTVYEITFKGKRESLPSGFLYIDTASYAINFIKYTRKKIKELFFIDVNKSDTEIKYKKYNSMWLLDYINKENVYEKFHKITYSNANLFYKTIDDKLLDTNLYSLNKSNLVNSIKNIDEFSEIRSISAPAHDSIWLKYRNIEELIIQPSFSEKVNLDTLSNLNIQTNSRTKNNKLLNYFNSNKISFGFFYSFVSNPLINLSSSTFTRHLKFNIYKNLSLNIDLSNNFGIGEYNIYKTYLYSSYPIQLNKKYSFDILFGFSRINVHDKKLNKFNSNKYLAGGFRIQKTISKHIFGNVQFSSSNFQFKDHYLSFGLTLKR